MDELVARAVACAQHQGASYADARLVELEREHLAVKDGNVEGVERGRSSGVGVRVISDGCWGFAATNRLEPRAVEETARLAVEIAESGRPLRQAPVRLAPAEPLEASYETPVAEDPFAVSLEDKLDLLVEAARTARQEPGSSLAQSSISAWRRHQLFRSSEGARIEQRITHTGGGLSVTAIADGEVQVRSYPNSFGGDFGSGGFELVRGLDLVGSAAPTAAEAVALLQADECPSEVTTVVLDGSQVALQVHESIGHPIELDRVLGMEAAFAGTSFLSVADRGRLRYGSPLLDVVADATTPGALGTFGYDDEGVPATSTPIVTKGIFRGFLSSRETASDLGPDERSGATVRAESWGRLPLIRMTNVSLLPGTAGSLDELLDGVERGVFMATNRSWSIDDRRVNFQFGTEWGREIRHGRLGRVLRNCTYTGRTLEFWSALDAVGGPSLWRPWGLPNCGKGQPEQIGYVAHGSAPARFRQVQVGLAR